MEPVEQKVYRPDSPESSPPLPPGPVSDDEVQDGQMETVPEGNEDEADEELDLQTQVNRLTEINENNTTFIKWLTKQIEILKAKNDVLTKLNVELSKQLAEKDKAQPED